jgi:acyl-coenzyme A thioesterase PaaI-like protein
MSDLPGSPDEAGEAIGAVPESVRRAFLERPPGRLMGRGHPIGDYLEAFTWELLEEREGFLRLRVHLPPQVRNPRGQLFGGFTPTYVDLVALSTAHAGRRLRPSDGWLATLQMRVDYFEPICDGFEIESAVIRRRGANSWVETRFLDEEGTLLALALTTLRETGRV